MDPNSCEALEPTIVKLFSFSVYLCRTHDHRIFSFGAFLENVGPISSLPTQ